jgi:hypothetical protein
MLCYVMCNDSKPKRGSCSSSLNDNCDFSLLLGLDLELGGLLSVTHKTTPRSSLLWLNHRITFGITTVSQDLSPKPFSCSPVTERERLCVCVEGEGRRTEREDARSTGRKKTLDPPNTVVGELTSHSTQHTEHSTATRHNLHVLASSFVSSCCLLLSSVILSVSKYLGYVPV